MSGELALLSSATRALAEVSSAKDAWELARTAEAARRYAQMKNMGAEAINYATGIKAKAMKLLADFVDRGQADGTIRTRGGDQSSPREDCLSIPQVLGVNDDADEQEQQKAYKAVHEARRIRDALIGVDIDELVADANDRGEDFGIAGLRMAAAASQPPEPVLEPIPPARGRYSCIVIDPPWPMQKIERRLHPDQGRELAYPIMSLDAIADEQWVPVRRHAADDCHLYLWVTHRFLPDAFDLLAGWGFDYQCVMTWRKNVGFTPFSWMYDTEHVLFGRRGNLPLLRNGLRLSFDAQVVGHSVKPDAFYERVIEASPGPRLEMFARTDRDGFTPWGNEVASAG